VSAAHDERVDVDLVAAQFELLDTETHRKALLEAIRARDAYRKLIDELREKIAKLEEGLIGPTRERFPSENYLTTPRKAIVPMPDASPELLL
jgi:uncharacterized coiled-coil DUF342 family protein